MTLKKEKAAKENDRSLAQRLRHAQRHRGWVWLVVAGFPLTMANHRAQMNECCALMTLDCGRPVFQLTQVSPSFLGSIQGLGGNCQMRLSQLCP